VLYTGIKYKILS